MSPSESTPSASLAQNLCDEPRDRRMLKESFRAAQRLQQRITLDYMR